MNRRCDQRYLREKQYRDSSNLDARVRLHTLFSTNRRNWHLWVFDRLELPSGARLLELGCGHARLWKINLDRIPVGWDVLLSDLSPGMLDGARRNLPSGGRRFTFQVIDAQSIPFAEGSFDAVIANHMLYHVPHAERAFSEIHRVLRPGGSLYAATNGRGHMAELFTLIQKTRPGAEGGLQPTSFTLETGELELARWFDEVELCRYADGLEITEVEPAIDYIRSMDRLTSEQLGACRRLVQEEIDRSGALRVTKDAGLYVATARRSEVR